MYMQALLGPGTLGVHLEFLHLTSDAITLPGPLLSLMRRLMSPVMSLLPNSPETSHHMLTGGAVVVGAGGAASELPVAEQVVTTQT